MTTLLKCKKCGCLYANEEGKEYCKTCFDDIENQGSDTLREDGDNPLVCERCSSPVQSGRYCDVCASEVSQALKTAFQNSGEKKIGDTRKRHAYHVGSRGRRK